jgi:hypothetical protein
LGALFFVLKGRTMQNNQGTAAVGGLIVGAAVTMGRRADRTSDRARNAESRAEDAQDTADEALSVAIDLRDSGDLARLAADQVGDLLAGVAYPTQNPTVSPDPFATAPSILARPALSEDLAAGPTSWPGTINVYNNQGNLVSPAQALSGQNFGTGLALGYAENRAMFMGLTLQGTTPTQGLERQLWRYFQAVTLELNSLVSTDGTGALSLDDYRAAVRRFLEVATPAGAGAVSSRRLDGFFTDSVTVTNTIAETQIATFQIPAGSLFKIGQILTNQFAITCLSTNGADTHRIRVRLDSIVGTLLFDTGAVAPAAGLSGTFSLNAAVRAIGTSGELALGGLDQYSGTVTGPAVNQAVISPIDFTIAHQLVVTVQHSAASAANQDRARWGQLTLQTSL